MCVSSFFLSKPSETQEGIKVHSHVSLASCAHQTVQPVRATLPYPCPPGYCSKTSVSEFRNARGHGKMFSMDLMDAEGALTRATVFNAVVDELLPHITVALSTIYSLCRRDRQVQNFANILTR